MPREGTPPSSKTESQAPDQFTRVLIVVACILALVAAAMAASMLQGDDGSPARSEAAEATDLAARPTSAPQLVASATPLPVTPPACVPPHDWQIHTVVSGNTLYSLAQRYSTDVDTLMLVNCLDSNLIYVGQDLYVPGPGGQVDAGALASSGTMVATAEPAVTPAADSQPGTVVNIKESFPERFVNIILLGSDKRKGSSTWRTDTMIVLSIDTESDIVRLLSIPRDLWVNIPGHGYDRINTADLWGELAQEGSGPELIKQTIYQSLGIPIHYYVRLDFDGFIKIIDAIGGVDIDVECPLPDIEFEPGMRHMDGEDALLYARSRKSTNDFDRSRRQRKLLMALWEQGLSADIIPRLPALWLAMSGSFQTDLGLDKVLLLANVGLNLRPSQIFSQSIGPWQVQNWITPAGAAVLLPIDEEIQKMLNAFYSPPDLEFLEKVGRTRVEVQNGSLRPDAAKMASTSLYWAGFQVTGAGNASRQDYTESQVIANIADADIVETVAMMLDLPRSSVQYQQDPTATSDVLVILGQDYDPCNN